MEPTPRAGRKVKSRAAYIQEEVASHVPLPASPQSHWGSTQSVIRILPQMARGGNYRKIYSIKFHFTNLSLRQCIRFHKRCITTNVPASPYASRIPQPVLFACICLHLNFNTRETFLCRNFYFSIPIPGQLILKEYNQIILPKKKKKDKNKSEHLPFTFPGMRAGVLFI